MLKHCVAPAFLAASLFAQQPYGDPTPGTGGFEPRLSAAGPWIGNANFGFDIQGGLGSTLAFVVFSTDDADLSLFGFNLLLNPAGNLGSILTLLTGSGPGEGEGFVPLPLLLPPTPALIGAPFFAQAVLSDGGSPGGNFSASQGVRFELALEPLVFVGCSIGSNDPYQLIAPFANLVVNTNSPPQVNNCSGAVFDDGGQRLFVSSSIGNMVGMANTATLPPTWTTIYNSAGPCYGLGIDETRDWLWTLTDPGTGRRELVALDVATGSPTFGGILVNTTNVTTSGIVERWSLSPSARRAAVLTAFPSSLTIVDTDPTSPTFLQNLVSQFAITPTQNGINLPNQVRITPDDRYALVIVQLAGATPSEIARFDIVNNAWIDHNPTLPGVQHMSPSSLPPVVLGGAGTGLSVSSDGRFAVVAGFNGCGWAGRIALDPSDPQSFGYTPWNPGVLLSNAWTASLSTDDTEVGIACWPRDSCPAVASPQLFRLEAVTGALLGTTPIAFNANPNTLQNLYTVVYR